MKGKTMTKKKSTKTKQAPAKTEKVDGEAYGRGRVARKRQMDRDAVTPEADKKSWQAGWDYQDKIEND